VQVPITLLCLTSNLQHLQARSQRESEGLDDRSRRWKVKHPLLRCRITRRSKSEENEPPLSAGWLRVWFTVKFWLQFYYFNLIVLLEHPRASAQGGLGGPFPPIFNSWMAFGPSSISCGMWDGQSKQRSHRTCNFQTFACLNVVGVHRDCWCCWSARRGQCAFAECQKSLAQVEQPQIQWLSLQRSSSRQ